MKEFLKNIKFVWKYSKGERKRIILYIGLSVVYIFASLIYPILSAQMLVKITENLLVQFISMGLIILSIDLLCDTISYFRSMMYEKIFRNIYINIQYDLGKEILKLSNKSLEDNGSGKFIQRLVGDTKSISTIFTDLNTYINGIIVNIGVIFAFFILNKTIFLVIMLALVIRFIIEIKRINTYNKNEKEYRKQNDEMTGFTGELVRGAEDIKMLNGETSFLNELRNKFSKLNYKKYEMEKTNLNYFIVRSSISDIFHFIVLVLIASFIAEGKMTLAIGLVVYNFSGKYGSLVRNITGFHELIKKFNLSAGRIFDVFNGDNYEKESFGNKHLDIVNGNFEFKNVTFKYDKNLVLKNLSFNVKKNETVAFVGKSGAGKTTIFNLLCKMYDKYDGEITIDGNDIRTLDKDTIRGNITIVSQSPYIFNMSIKDNLKLVKADLTNKEMKEACKMACLDDFIESLPEKYDTVVGEGGVNLSGGQKQRLAIARAFVQKTEIILFDEATSALDNETQAKIQEAIDNLQKNFTILIIAHRLSTIRNADRILVLDEGRIVAEGKHKELLKKCEVYKELYDMELSKK